MTPGRLLAIALAAAVLACGGGDSSPPAPSVSVTRLVTRWLEDGTQQAEVPGDVASIEIVIPDGSGGSKSLLLPSVSPGRWSADVSVSGGFWVVVSWTNAKRSYLWTTSTTVDLGVDVAGRDVAGDFTINELAVGLSGLRPWSAADDVLQAFSFDAQARVEVDPSFVEGTTVGTLVIDFYQNMLPPLVPTDRLWIAQGTLSPTPASPGDWMLSYHAVTQVSGIDMQPNANNWTGAIAPPFVEATELDAISLHWRTSAFEAGLPELDPSLGPPLHLATVYSSPVPLTAPSPGAAWTMELMRVLLGAPHPDTDFGSLSWGRFLAPSWNAALSVSYFGVVARSVAGEPPTYLTCGISTMDELATAPAVAAPRVTMVRNARVDGIDVTTSPASGVGTSPTLSWDVPEVGRPTSYRIQLLELFDSGGATSRRTIADAVVYDPVFPIPPGLLEAGKTYVAKVEAVVTDTDLSTAEPWRTGLPRARAAVYTQTFAP